ncbi:MAG: hypothetical protein A2Z71_01685 [Chloroflexi bacterium RBG_13_50_21]|nr:MAG: hypothetical protein A2Z71_01685 [Chloroflexi bacterium RBG_13_50_21]
MVVSPPEILNALQTLAQLGVDERRRFWIVYSVANGDKCDLRKDLRQEGMEVKIAFPMSHKALTIVLEYVQ